ncbi:MAG: phospholipase D family protein [Gammaproteobacteria bacterium]
MLVRKSIVFVAIVQLVVGCATVDFDAPKVATSAVTDTAGTALGREIESWPRVQAGESGFYVLLDGIDALSARLALAARAERSIDAQYYHLHDDVASRLLADALIDAADRGVRVRLLLDDALTKGLDRHLAAIDAHPNIELRLFNPFANRSSRGWNFLRDFGRVNRRMHNKSFTVDNEATVIGGRNIAEEYFAINPGVNFGDVDVLGFGPVVREVSGMFDEYWNHRVSVPVRQVVAAKYGTEEDLAKLKGLTQGVFDSVGDTPYAPILKQQVIDFIWLDESVLVWSPYDFIYDSPDKALRDRPDDVEILDPTIVRYLFDARDEVLIISPYFVPRGIGEARLAELRNRGIRVRVVTNSLASTNQKAVHSGYAASRKKLLAAGVELYEVHPDGAVAGVDRVGQEDPRATLHGKAFAVDRDKLFLGSFNFDPRSTNINTEMGIVFDSPEMTGRFLDLVDEKFPSRTFRVDLDERGKLRWTGEVLGEQVVTNKEPDAKFWLRFKSRLIGTLPIKDQL